jgi:predicted metal-dependent HD superfamily phosphohydrolase
MRKVDNLLVAESESYISALLNEKLPEQIVFHHYGHVLQVRKNAETIGEQEGLSPDEMNILRVCALFQDSGYLKSFEKPHEESAAMVSSFLAERGIEQNTIDRIAEIMHSTRLPQSPKDKVAEVLCDAAMMFIAAEDGLEQFDLLYDETVLTGLNSDRRPAFEKRWIDLLTNHTYFTGYGRSVLQPRKESALTRLSARLKRRKLVEPKKEIPEKRSADYPRGVETMFRITARNQINLNSIADNKSNILISVNAIIISIIITMLAGNIGTLSNDIVPIIIFLVVCLATVIIAILSTRPNIVTRRFTDEDLKNKNVDLIFFGNFIKLDYDEYEDAVKEMMKDDEHLYSTLLRNQYELGKILSKKFRLVRTAYNVFMVGIIITVIAFLVKYLIF